MYGTASTGGGTPVLIGGMFSLYGLTDTIGTLTSAAVIADNAAATDPIFLARDNGTTVFAIVDGGNVGIGSTTPNSTLQVSGSMSCAIVSKTGTYVITASDYTILCDASGGSFAVTLPSVSGTTGRVYVIKKIDSSVNTVTVDGDSSDLIDGATTQVLTAIYESITIQSNGSAWYII
jgi:hypothetical protein